MTLREQETDIKITLKEKVRLTAILVAPVIIGSISITVITLSLSKVL